MVESTVRTMKLLAHSLLGLALLGWFSLWTFSGIYLAPGELASSSQALSITLSILFWLVPVFGLWLVLGPLLNRSLPGLTNPEGLPLLLGGFLVSGGLITIQVSHGVQYALAPEYFNQVRIATLAFTIIAFVYNGVQVMGLARLFNVRDKSWADYRNFKKETESSNQKSGGIFGQWGIQSRMVVSFVGIILVVVGVLCWVLLTDFSATILSSVHDGGKSLAERSARVIKNSIGDDVAIEDYLRDEATKNATATYPFIRIEYRQRSKDAGMIRTQYWDVASGSMVTTIEDDHDFRPEETSMLDQEGGNQLEFVSPVVLSGTWLGYVSVAYDKDRILEPYFRTQVKVFVIASIFIYFSVLLTYLFGRNIVIPILFLRMSVYTIAKRLAEIIKSDSNRSTDDLEYTDRVKTKDEIKTLSTEIGNMTTVIRHVIPYISKATLKQADKGGESSQTRELAFLFTDIRGFTSLCEGLAPDEVVGILNTYLDLQTTIILANHGDIDKFVGDEIMAVFEGEHKERNACRAALEIRTAMANAKASALEAGKKYVEIGIGINAGPVVFGSVGSRSRMDFTSIGDNVNLAARLEGANKNYGTRSLISEAVHEKIKDEFLCREIDLMTVVGKKQPVRIYEILTLRAEARKEDTELAASFEKALGAYRAQDWDGAQRIFFPLWQNQNDGPAEIFAKRIDLFRKAQPPENWDGVFALTIK